MSLSRQSSVPFGPELVIERAELSNGLKVRVLRDPSAPVVSYHTWLSVGSRHEREGKTGIAHLLEHLMFHETSTMPKGEYDRVLEAAGADVNAATWKDWTQYHIEAPRSQLPLIVRLEADRLENLVLESETVSAERDVVMSERRMRVEDDVDGLVGEALWKTALTRSSYRWPTIGWMDDIRGLRAKDCQSFYKRYYAPNRASLIVVGDVEPENVFALVEREYGSIPKSRTRAEQPLYKEPPQRKERRISVETEAEHARVCMGYRAPGYATRDWLSLSLVARVLTGLRSSRLRRVLVDELQLAGDVWASNSPFEHGNLFEIGCAGRSGVRSAKLLRALDRELKRFLREGVSESELEAAKAGAELDFYCGLETAHGKADQLGFYDVVTGDLGFGFRRMEVLAGLSAAQVEDAARRLLVPTRRTIATTDGRFS